MRLEAASTALERIGKRYLLECASEAIIWTFPESRSSFRANLRIDTEVACQAASGNLNIYSVPQHLKEPLWIPDYA